MLNKPQSGVTQKFTITKDNKAETKKILAANGFKIFRCPVDTRGNGVWRAANGGFFDFYGNSYPMNSTGNNPGNGSGTATSGALKKNKVPPFLGLSGKKNICCQIHVQVYHGL